MPTTTDHPAFTAADKLAPLPDSRDAATLDVWVRYYAARALAAHVVSSDYPAEMGVLVLLFESSTAAALGIVSQRGQGPLGTRLWDTNLAVGDAQAAYEWVTRILDTYGINPADIDSRLTVTDFVSHSVTPV